MKAKDVINTAYTRLSKCSKLNGWERVLGSNLGGVQVFSHPKHNAFKTEAVLKCSPKLLFNFCSDIHGFTRNQWDFVSVMGLGKLMGLRVLKNLDDEVMCEIVIDLEFSRQFRGLFWKNAKKYTCLFQSETVLYGCWIRETEENVSFMCQIIISTQYKPNPAELYDRVVYLEVATKKFSTIYNPVTCHGCRQSMPSWALECRRDTCKVERFGRCSDVACYTPSMSIDQEKCLKCGSSVNKINF